VKLGLFVAGLMMAAASTAFAAPSCQRHNGMTVADMSQPITTIRTKGGKSGLEAFKSIGVKTIARYYAEVGEETTCKTMYPEESDAIIAAGLSIITVFQHENSNPEKFFKSNVGEEDVRHALKLASANGQPPGSAIYFAVDGVDQTIKDAAFEFSLHRGKAVSKGRRVRLLRADQSFKKHLAFYNRYRTYYKRIFNKSGSAVAASDMLPFVERYFNSVNKAMKADGRFKIGVYGSGAVCKLILEKKLAQYCWIAQSKAWPGTPTFLRSGKWNLAQEHTTFCPDWKYNTYEKVRFDLNRVRTKDFGQWSKKVAAVAAKGLPEKCRLGW
jgi:Domain of unknown function (DUF1906)